MINSYIQPIVKDYLWQKDKFHLSIVYDQNHDPPYPFLFGASRFGDCINDEWLIVYLLKSISQRIPDSIISLLDNDGDVLLIEAALALPPWLDPSNSQNRVYLYDGNIHIIPLPTSPADIGQQALSSGSLLRERAIKYIRDHCERTLAPSAIQQSIDDRLLGYPSCIQDDEIHCARCIMPNLAVFVLLTEPQLITLAIEAFYLRDPLSMKACASMKIFNPLKGTTETVIKFTKTTYAQTVHQKFYAPKPFRLPSVNERKKFKYAELGMKVACGLEMLYYNHANDVNHTEEEYTVDTYPFEKDKKFADYKSHLHKLGYFRSEKQGSQLYNFLIQQSKEQYLAHKREQDGSKRYVSLNDLDVDDEDTFRGSHPILSTGETIRRRIDTIISQYSTEALERLLTANTLTEDSDEWMNVDPQQLEELLMKRMGHLQESMMTDLQKDFTMNDTKDIDLQSIMSSLENFVEHNKSGIEGVEFPSQMLENEDEDFSDEDNDSYDEEGPIQFDVQRFMDILKGKSQEDDLTKVMEEMDQEISGHDKISGSFEKIPTRLNPEEEEEEEEDINAPVDVQLNLVKNVLESFKSQQGLPGPVGNMLNQFGIVLPGDNEEDDD
ncbi:SGT1 protein-domain-containing protein [Cokeromyces recurvatus]|uniref:SGT1 protein-domain-containing protein n=1 Tax=Cokeromyces recurvatus TaxID=90255 RepID=UPI00221E4E86|nr:SGT1 protein-domain-containing protein [Cokeromyces recurvatus]KAI7898786.1 SGT1 protein-domain-containing protein [Cokeromyces recurvatus]